MTRPRIPPIGALLGFEAAARHKSFSGAARELHLTQGAISRQIIGLEQQIGVDLFVRARQRIELTQAGRDYLAEVQDVLARLAAATERVSARASLQNRLNLAVQPTFATRWLIPRLPGFINQHPEIQINFAVRAQPFDFVAEQFDVAIHYGRLAVPEVACEILLEDRVTPVCSPAFQARHEIASAADLTRTRLLEQTTRMNMWPDFFKQMSVRDRNSLGAIQFERIPMIIEAAVAGLGVALLPRFLIEDELDRQQLVMLFRRKTLVNGGYFIVHHRSQKTEQSRTFATWLKKTARPYRTSPGRDGGDGAASRRA